MSKRLLTITSLLLLAGLMLAACASATPTPPPPTPTRAGIGVTEVPVISDAWQRIKAAGKMLVGTSADYPPFEFYTSDFKLDGFDIALMQAIGQKLGVQVEFNDFAFEGLLGAVQLKQVDVAIGAISVTPERAVFVDFSNVYFVGEDALLARQDSTLAVSAIEQLAGQRIGVQRGTVYEELVLRSLVNTGQMPPSNLFSYVKPEHAVRDLNEQRVDVVILGALPAETYVGQGGVKIVGRGLNQQRFGIALPKAEAPLKRELDQALTELHNEGTIAALAERYLNIASGELPPPPPPEPPPPTPVPPTPGPPPCIDGMAWVQDLNYDDVNMTAPPALSPGQAFTKGWRIKNSGTCPWETSFRLVFLYGNVPAAQMGGQPIALTHPVNPGETYDIHVNLIAPGQPGTYQGFWQMVNGQNTPFGERIWVGITIPSPPTPTPAATQTPAPGIQFFADRTFITAGEPVRFTWNVENVRAVYFYAQGEPWEANGVPGQGSRDVYPQVTTTYELRVRKLDDTVEIRQVRIDVQPAPNAPAITRFTVDPDNQIVLGQCVIIAWEVQGAVNSVSITANGVGLWDGAPASGNLQNCPSSGGGVVYAIAASGPGGNSHADRYINVLPPDPPLPPPTPPPPAQPVINGFFVSPNQIQAGQCVTIGWDTGGGTSHVQIKRNDTVLQDYASLAGQMTDCPTDAGNYVYLVVAFNPEGISVNRQAQVHVSAAPPSNPLADTQWLVTGLNGGPPLRGPVLNMRFGADGRVNGFGGCGDFSAAYTVNAGLISIADLTHAPNVCQPEAVAQEESFFNALRSAVAFEVQDSTLILFNLQRQEVVRAVRQ